MVKRKRARVPTTDATELFESTVVALCRDHNVHRRFKPQDIDRIVQTCVAEYAGTLEELSIYIENEDWDAIVQLATQEQTRKAIRAGLRMRL
jgi:hypothetical protein